MIRLLYDIYEFIRVMGPLIGVLALDLDLGVFWQNPEDVRGTVISCELLMK